MLTERMQIQAIADRLAGIDGREIKLQKFREPWRRCYAEVLHAPTSQALMYLRNAIQGHKDREVIIDRILAATPGSGLQKFKSLAEIAGDLQPVAWLWQDWIPRGMISLLGAVPGAGKSYMALDLARRIIGGMNWPDGLPMNDAGQTVVYVDAEAIPQVINDRAMAWEMDRSRLYLMMPEEDLIDFSRQEDQDRLVEMMHAVDPALVIIDSLSSISSRGENNVEDVRALLGFLNGVALDFECGLLLVHHLRKQSTLPLLQELSADSFRGSGHIIAMARSVLGLNVVQTGPEADRNGPRKLQVVKTNLAAYPDALGCEFVPLHPTGVMLKWGEAPEQYHELTKGEECGEWLVDFLEAAGKPVSPKDIVEAAESEGFSRIMVYRAREELTGQIVNTLGRKDPRNAWTLAELLDEDGDTVPQS